MTLKLRVLSDLHFEFQHFGWTDFIAEITAGEFDVLVLAGDVADSRRFHEAIKKLAKAVEPRPVVYVLGNHEFYGEAITKVEFKVGKLATQVPNLTVLDNAVTTIQGQRFVGSTLWYLPPNDGREKEMGDYAYIKGKLRWLEAKAKAGAAFLRENIQPGDVVITHMVPHPNSIAPRFERSPINSYFVHNIRDAVEYSDVKLWIHGHTHESFDYVVGKTRVVCNPFGYAMSPLPREPNPDFDSTKTVEV